MAKYTKLTGDPKHGAVPPGEYNLLQTYMGEWESLVGYTVEPTKKQLLAMANQGVLTLSDFAKFMSGQKNAKAAIAKMPWAGIGISKDEYQTAETQFGTTYKGITGADISKEELAKAFKNRDPTGQGLLSASEYKQQLMNDTAIQNAFGWVKYGYDFNAWTQQKLQLHATFGRDVKDAEASTILQYTKTATGANMGAVGRQVGQQVQPPSGAGVSGSVAR